MSKTNRVFAFFFVMLFLATVATPLASNSMISDAKLLKSTFQRAATTYNVDVRVFNYQLAFNDDDFEFRVRNGSTPLNNAWVRLYNASSGLLADQTQTDGNGYAWFYNLAQGTYNWNVSDDSDPITPAATGQIISNGPEAYVTIHFGNLDWQNDDDDLNATITDIEGNPAANLNFSLIRISDGSLYAQTEVINGIADFQDITPGNYTWTLTVLGDPTYNGYLLDEGEVESNGTQLLAHQSVGPLTGDPQYYDLEVFTYYETSLLPLVGADVVLMYKNGTVIGSKVTPANGTVTFVDLPIAFINWSITYSGLPVGLGDYWYNLSSPVYDIHDPVILASPSRQSCLLDSENVTLTWTITDEFPASIEVWVNNALNMTTSWVNTTYDFVFNVSASFPEFAIGDYEITLKAIDQNSNFAEDTITFQIHENVTPVIEGPNPVEFYFTETGYTLTWNVTDDYLNMYRVTRDNESIAEGIINREQPVITISLDGLSIGVHNFTLYANDTSGNTAANSVLVTVLSDDVPPVITYSPGTIYYAQGDSDLTYNWTATDNFKDHYTIDIDGAVIVNATWTTENIEFDFSGLFQGEHEVTLKVYDLGGNMAESTVQVFVSDPLAVRYL
ncbi:MAG: collagen binding domain-containing protein, partial [Promethearchaeota archaeon]